MGGMVGLVVPRCGIRVLVRRLVLIDTSPSGSASRMAIPTLRALGLRRTLTVLRRAAAYIGLWSWRKSSDERTLAQFSIMATMQEGDPRFR